MVLSLKDLKDEMSRLYGDEAQGAKNNRTDVSFDYVSDPLSEGRPFNAFSLDMEDEPKKIIMDEVKAKICSYKDENVIDFDFTKELGQNQIGIIPLANCPDRLISMIKATEQPNKGSQSFSQEDKENVVCYVITMLRRENDKYVQIKIIKKLHLSKILSKNKKKPRLGLMDGTVRGMPEDFVLMSPESFDLVVMDDTAFIINEKNFHYLFSGAGYLKSKIEQNKSKLESEFEGVDNLIEYASKNYSVLRGLYHVVMLDKITQIDSQKIKNIESMIVQQKGIKEPIFTYSHKKIKCTPENAKYLYYLLAKKYGLNLIDGNIFVAGSTYPV